MWSWQRLVTSESSDLGTNHFKNASWQVSYCLLRIKDPDQLATSLFTVDFASPSLQCMGIEMVTPSFLWNTLGSTVRLARITRHQSICLARPEWRWQAGCWDFIGYGGWSWGKLPPPHTQRVTLEQNTEYHTLTLCHVIHKRLPVGRWRLFGGCGGFCGLKVAILENGWQARDSVSLEPARAEAQPYLLKRRGNAYEV
jgi:hypothetical protein